MIDDGSGWCDVNRYYAHKAAGTLGSGTYLFQRPGHYPFNTSIHPLNIQLIEMSTTPVFRKVIPATAIIQSDGTVSYSLTAVVP